MEFAAGLRPGLISQARPGSRAVYSHWWKGPGRGSIGARQVQYRGKASVLLGMETRDEAKQQRFRPLGSSLSLTPVEYIPWREPLYAMSLYVCEHIRISSDIRLCLHTCVELYDMGWEDQQEDALSCSNQSNYMSCIRNRFHSSSPVVLCKTPWAASITQHH